MAVPALGKAASSTSDTRIESNLRNMHYRYADRHEVAGEIFIPDDLQLPTGHRQLRQPRSFHLVQGVIHEPDDGLTDSQILDLLDVVFPLFGKGEVAGMCPLFSFLIINGMFDLHRIDTAKDAC